MLRYIALAIYYFRITSPSTFQYYCKPCLNFKFLKCSGLQGPVKYVTKNVRPYFHVTFFSPFLSAAPLILFYIL